MGSFWRVFGMSTLDISLWPHHFGMGPAPQSSNKASTAARPARDSSNITNLPDRQTTSAPAQQRPYPNPARQVYFLQDNISTHPRATLPQACLTGLLPKRQHHPTTTLPQSRRTGSGYPTATLPSSCLTVLLCLQGPRQRQHRPTALSQSLFFRVDFTPILADRLGASDSRSHL